MQRDKIRDRCVGRWIFLFPGAAAEHIHNLLHNAGLLRLLLSRLLDVGARRWCRTVGRCQVGLAVLELSLRRGTLRWC
jgi:hypothetical protein